MGKAPWPRRADEWVSACFTHIGRVPGMASIPRAAMTVVVMARALGLALVLLEDFSSF